MRLIKLDQAFEMLENTKKIMPTVSNNMERAYQYTLAEYYYLIGENTKTEKLLMDASIQYEIGNKERALVLVEDLIAMARKTQNKLKIVEGDLLKARILLENQGVKRDVQNLFIEAVSYAAEDRIANPFWFEKTTSNRILNELKSELEKELSKEEMEFVSCVLTADTIHGVMEKAIHENKNHKDKLTEREKEVLLELSKGSTNVQIAEQLCVSLATVKSHINNIYGKLGVNNRVAALNKVKELFDSQQSLTNAI